MRESAAALAAPRHQIPPAVDLRPGGEPHDQILPRGGGFLGFFPLPHTFFTGNDRSTDLIARLPREERRSSPQDGGDDETILPSIRGRPTICAGVPLLPPHGGVDASWPGERSRPRDCEAYGMGGGEAPSGSKGAMGPTSASGGGRGSDLVQVSSLKFRSLQFGVLELEGWKRRERSPGTKRWKLRKPLPGDEAKHGGNCFDTKPQWVETTENKKG